MGLIYALFYYAGDVDVRRASDQAGDQSTCVDRVRPRSTRRSIARALIKEVITAVIEFGREHRDRRIAIQQRKNNAFYNASQGDASGPSIHDPTEAIFPKTVHHGPFIVTVDRFDRTVTKFRPLNSPVLHKCKHPSEIQSN